MSEHNNLNILIVEDNKAFTDLICLLLQEMGFKKIFTADNYKSGLKVFETNPPDLCLVDIDLGKDEKTGIHLVEKIRETAAALPVIYLTSNYSEDYYEQCRHTRPSSFMNKELSRFKLFHAIDLALLQINSAETTIVHTLAPPPLITHNNFFFKIGDVYKSIPVQEVSYFFADNKLNYAKVGQRSFPTTVQLKTIESEFHPAFLRIHKSYLVNVKLITDIRPGESTLQINGETLPIGYAYKKTFFDQIPLLK